MIQKNYIKIYESAFKELWSLPALTNYSCGTTYSYAEVAKWVAKVHLQLKALGVEPQEKVVLIAKDSAEWCMTFMGVITYGAVVVPILPDFHVADIHNIINHSDATVVYSGDKHIEELEASKLPKVRAVVNLQGLKISVAHTPAIAENTPTANWLFEQRYPEGFTQKDIVYPNISNEEVMVINYTSGTMGFSKGVILTANNLAGNVLFADAQQKMLKSRRMLCFLPLAHAYSCAFNFLTPLQSGTHVFILGALPTPSLLLKAFADVKPHIIITVPLILEKMYKNVILPAIQKAGIRIALRTPIISGVIGKKIRQQMVQAMGGKCLEIIVGGAPMSEEVSAFLSKIKFPYTVGYGMTECAPLISYVGSEHYKAHSCGKPLEGYMEVRIDDSIEGLPAGTGEIQVRGENTCKGYFKNPEATQQLFTSDGWMRTGDIGLMDAEGYLFIKGRSKTMLLGPSGQNIYPEELEARLNLMPCIAESLVIQNKKGALVALVYPDAVAVKAKGLSPQELLETMERNRAELNTQVASYEKIAKIIIRDEDFQRTPKNSIKRYLYQEA